jgi:hypothetical protein
MSSESSTTQFSIGWSDLVGILLFVLVSISLMFMWNSEHLHAISGDEGHYLVAADGILPGMEIDVTGPYSREFQNRKIVPDGLAAQNATPSEGNTHALRESRGFFSFHGLGLPLALSLPFILGGELGARFAMIAFASCLVLLLLKTLVLLKVPPYSRLIITLPLVIGMPFTTAASRIYPDLLVGVLCAFGGYIILRGARKTDRRFLTLSVCLLSVMPWIHLRYLLPLAILLVGVSVRWRKDLSMRKILQHVWLPFLISTSGFLFYNFYCFSNIFGPYSANSLDTFRNSTMRFLGLLFDQNQGILMIQPLHFIGFFFLAYLLRNFLLFTSVMSAVVVSTIAPNAWHSNPYGGYSFSGRFGWTAAAVFSLLTSLAFAKLMTMKPKLANALLFSGLSLQMVYLWHIMIDKTTLMPRLFDAWSGTYSIFWPALENLLPQWRNSAWAFSYLPNYLWMFFSLAIVMIGAVSHALSFRRSSLLIGGLITGTGFLLAVSALVATPDYPPREWSAVSLPSQVGKIDDDMRTASRSDGPGFIVFGANWNLPKGQYQLGLLYSADGQAEELNGLVDLYQPSYDKSLSSFGLTSTDSKVSLMQYEFSVTKQNVGDFEFRIFAKGLSQLSIKRITLRHLGG